MDETDKRIIAHLHKDGRASLSDLASVIGITRTTARVRLDKLKSKGEIVGFRVVTRADVAPDPVRGLMMLEIAGRGTERIARQLTQMPAVRAVHSTNGAWDLIAEVGTETLEEFDQVLTAIRRWDGITKSETSLLLSTRR